MELTTTTTQQPTATVEWVTLEDTMHQLKTIELRPYQRQFIDALRDEIINGQRRICGVAPCGAGKTIMMGWMIREAVSRGKRCIFFVHRKELIEQTSATFYQLGIPHGIISSGTEKQYDLPVQIASVQTLVKRLDKIPKPDLLICDECHHIKANSYMEIINYWKNAILIGVTATPERLGGVRLGDIFSAMVEAPTVKQLIEMGNLTHFEYFAPTRNIDLSGVRVKFNEFVKSDLEKRMTNSKIIGDIVENYKHYADGLSAICYCVNVKHSQYVADKFNAAGIPAAHVDGDTDKTIRSNIVNDFRAGKIKILCNAELFGEGFDVPNVHAIILARPTMSLTLYIQQSMRGMRPDPNNPDKVAVIIDHVENYKRFGLPDAPRNWSLDPNAKNPPPIKTDKTCPECFAVVPMLARVCPYCGYVFAGAKRDPNFVESQGAVAQIYTSSNKSLPSDSPIAQTYYHFCGVAKTLHYKPLWAAIRATEKARSYNDCVIVAELAGYKQGWAYYRWEALKKEKMPVSRGLN